MSKLSELIEQFCPEGVEYQRIGEIAEVGTGSSNGNEAIDNGKYPFYVRSQIIKAKDDYEFDEEAIIIPGEGGIGEIFHYVNEKYALHQRVYRIHFTTPNINVKFAFYYMQAQFKAFIMKKAVSATVTSIRKPMIEGFPLPVPPLEVQSEIVRILDNFTELTAELTEKLTAELTARKKQYEYYRDKLLHLDGEHITIQELFDTRNGFTPSKDNPEFWENGELPWFKLDDINNKGRVLSDSYLHITPQAVKKSGLFPETSIIISTSATIGEYALITVPFLCNQRFTCMTVKPIYRQKVDVKYLMHYCPILSKYCKEHLNQGNFASVDMKQFVKFEFVIPPLEEQQRIVDILDRFDKLCNDISEGLPAEIEARQKQYEYYRDKLLTFNKAD